MHKKKHNTLPLQEGLLLLKKRITSTSVPIATILDTLSGKGRLFFLLILSLPFCQPLQIPGFSTPFGLLIAFLSLRLIFEKNSWFPKKWLQKKIPSKTLKLLIDKTLLLLNQIQPWIHPRWAWLFRSKRGCSFHYCALTLLGLLLALPLPIPFSNLITAWSIFFLSVGLMEEDGLILLIGYFLFALTIFFLIFAGLTLEKVFTSI